MNVKLWWGIILAVLVALLIFGLIVVAAAGVNVFRFFYVIFDGKPTFASGVAFAGALLYGALVAFVASQK